MTDELVSVTDLRKYYAEERSLLDQLLGIEPTPVRAVDGISFDVREGETLGLVGESGCGKSTAAHTLLRLLDPTGGRVEFDGRNVFEMSSKETKEFRKRCQIVFQDPFSSLNPRMTVGDLIREPLAVHDVGDKDHRRRRAEELLERVGLSEDQIDRYPHEFSGGQRQRIGIARALALEPEFVVLDEPVSALDVSVQAQILNLLDELQDDFGLTYLFIAHDLGVVRHICDRVVVMYLGKIAEVGTTEQIFDAPAHPYTEALLESIPRASMDERDREYTVLPGDVPSPRNPPRGCRFHTRCPDVIPPDGYDVDQEVWRNVMNLWVFLENEAQTVRDLAREDLDLDESTSVSKTHVDRFLRDSFDVPRPLADDAAERVLGNAMEEIAADDMAGALERLAEAFPTVCRTDEPTLASVESDHECACFLVSEERSESTNVVSTED